MKNKQLPRKKMRKVQRQLAGTLCSQVFSLSFVAVTNTQAEASQLSEPERVKKNSTDGLQTEKKTTKTLFDIHHSVPPSS